MRTVIEYKIVASAEINEQLQFGWQPWGSAIKKLEGIWQPMVRYADLM